MIEVFAKAACEFVGTAAIVFFASGAVMVSAVLGAIPTPLLAGSASGLVVMIVVWSFGGISGAHVNPALTLVFALTRRFSWRLVPIYIVAQMLGSVAGAGLLYGILGTSANMGANLPNVELGVQPLGAFAIEVWLSFLMMLVIETCIRVREPLRDFSAIPIGAIVGIEVMIMGPVAGAAMNPARAFGPYVFDGQWQYYWIYLVGSFAGIWIAALFIAAAISNKAIAMRDEI